MGLFSKLFNNEEKANNRARFNEDYEKLKDMAGTILRYKFLSNFTAETFNKVWPLCDEFITIANEIDKKEAVNRFKKEAKEDSASKVFSTHKVFETDYKGDGEEWERVIAKINSVKVKLERWNDGVTRFNEKYANVPDFAITLNEPNIKRNKLIELPEIKFSSVSKSFNKDKLMTFVVVDTETTGLKASSERIIQLSAVKYVDWEPVGKWNTYINPMRDIPAEASTINGITNEMVADAPTIKEVHDSFLAFVGESPVVGYNLPFDYKFLYMEGIDLTEQKRKYYDVMSIAKKKYKDDLYSYALTDVANFNNIYFDAHNSLNDCFATAEVFECLVDEITEGK